MTTRDNSSNILWVILLIITFPLWFAIGAALFGVMAGLIGAAVGIIAAIFTVGFAIITLPFKILFGWGDWSFGHWWFPSHWHGHGLVWISLILIVVLILRRKR